MDYVEFRTVMEEVRVRAPNLRTVADLLRGSPLEWQKEYVLYLFGREEGGRILSISLSNRLGRDTLIWKEARDGKFSVKGAYWFEQQGRFNSNNEIWRLIRDGKMHPRQSIFLWRLCVGALPTKDKYAGESNQECVLCGFCCESADHLFMQCPLSRALWLGAPLPVKSNEVSGENLTMKVLTLVKGLSKDLRLQAMVSFAAVCDTVWNQRNAIIHGGKCGDIPSLLKEVWRKFVEFGGDKAGEVSDSRSHVVTRPLVPYQFNKMVMVDGAYKESWCGMACTMIDKFDWTWDYGYFSKEGSSSLEAEMSAIGLAVEVIVQKEWVGAVILSDCQVAVTAFDKRKCPDWKLTDKFLHILDQMSKCRDCKLVFVKRDFLTFVNSLAVQARNERLCKTFCIGEGLPPVNPSFLV
ncbi:hypothetical protein G4B88_008303 [Cannabis sativa]|uniref:Reverse transcriptase zinc-binding domain-containing protein n=1 Tax=Cannabis sativa TaxID=3483 RepID=A0A7J6FLS2_CANSA|nr:hypothetical protein G4B88_008303 [Cannabis sativa]